VVGFEIIKRGELVLYSTGTLYRTSITVALI